MGTVLRTVTRAQDGVGGVSISCPSTSQCWMLENSGIGVPQRYELLTSDDAGGRWAPVASTGLSGADIADLGSLTCPSVGHCAVVDNTNDAAVQTILVTQDGGRHWRSERDLAGGRTPA